MAKVKQKVSGCFRTAAFVHAYCLKSSYLQTMVFNDPVRITRGLEIVGASAMRGSSSVRGRVSQLVRRAMRELLRRISHAMRDLRQTIQ